jgi:hypothetical protein
MFQRVVGQRESRRAQIGLDVGPRRVETPGGYDDFGRCAAWPHVIVVVIAIAVLGLRRGDMHRQKEKQPGQAGSAAHSNSSQSRCPWTCANAAVVLDRLLVATTFVKKLTISNNCPPPAAGRSSKLQPVKEG